MEKVTAYKCLNGALETDLDRAIAWDLVHIAKQVSTGRVEPVGFTAALWLVQNKELVMKLLSEKTDERAIL